MHAHKKQLRTLKTLRKRSDFLNVQGKGRKWVSQSLILQTCPNNTAGKRVGFTVTKRVSKSAVQRNRIKRRLRAAAADVFTKHGLASQDYVLVGRLDTAILPYEKLCTDLKWCLRKMDLLEKKAPKEAL